MIRKLFFLITMSFLTIGYAQTFTENYITYEVISNSNNVKTTDYNVAGGTVVNIPDTVVNNGVTYTVTEIGAMSFVNKGLTSVDVSDNVTTIGIQAFENNQLTTVSLGTGIIEIKEKAFHKNKLVNLIIPNNITSVDRYAFFDNLLENVTISNNITQIGFAVFGKNKLANISIPSNVTIIDDYAFYDNLLTSVIIPNTVTLIGSKSFMTNKLTSIEIPNSVTEIGIEAFRNNLLSNVLIGSGLSEIKSGVFRTNKLTNVVIPNNITSIGNMAFRTNELVSVSLSNNLEVISGYAFEVNQLNNVTIPNNVISIGAGAFLTNNLNNVISESSTPPTVQVNTFGDRSGISLTIPSGTMGAYVTDAGALWTGFSSVTEQVQTFTENYITYEVLPTANNTVKTIGYDVAGGTVVNIPDTVVNNGVTYTVTEIGYISFKDKQLTSISLPSNLLVIGAASLMNNQLTSISIPNGVTTIWDSAFRDNQLTNITFPNSVTSIGNFAFVLNQLTNVTLPNNISTLEEGVFGNNQLTNINIPNSVTTIELFAFSQNQLTSVTIPNSVTSMEMGVFYNNPLVSVISESIIPPAIATHASSPSEDTFGNRSGVNLTIPSGTMGAYVTDAGALWTGFNSVVDTAITWTGATNNDWNTASNWNINSIPVASSMVTIPDNLTNYPTISSAVTVSSINIASGASLIANASITGNVTYTRNLPTTNWYLISSPVNGETYDNFIINNSFATGNGNNIGIGFFSNLIGSAWNYATASSTGTLPNHGYSVKLATAGNLSFTGSINSVNINNSISTGTRNNFNLIGNPFTSYVNSTAFTVANTGLLSEETIWLWDGNQYVTYNASTPIEIAPTQGFFVEANGNGSVTFAASNQSHQSTDTFMRQTPNPSFELFIESGEDKKGTKVFYIEGKTKGFDNGYDSKIFGGVDYDFALFTQLLNDNDGRNLAIQTLPNSNIETMVIPIGLIASANKEITFSVTTTNLPSGVEIYLEDRTNNTFFNLSEENHTITTQSNINGAGQYFIHTTSQRLSNEDVIQNVANIKIYKSAKQEITITGLQVETNVKIFSLTGKELVNNDINTKGSTKITLDNLSTGIYLVKLNSALGKVSKKIIIE
ncbi:leucine-rich repeat protein [Tenacibaculum sp. ZS6-P6]|uniref:leucine-rich repeat protein n=1 Tax=Tenacibaculum sp. ZS6-P6 TaxID=3447503 RepID=UPI003F9ADB0F